MSVYSIRTDLDPWKTEVYVFSNTDVAACGQDEAFDAGRTRFKQKNTTPLLASEPNVHEPCSSSEDVEEFKEERSLLDEGMSLSDNEPTDEFAPLLKVTVVPNKDEDEVPLPSNPDLILLVLPGNPGLPRLYITFCKNLVERIAASSGKSCLVVCPTSLALNQVGYNFDSIDANAQVAHKAEIIQSLQRLYPQAPLHVAGHSFGGWIGLRLIEQMPLITSYTGICPVVYDIKSTQGAKDVQFYTNPIVRFFVMAALKVYQLLPESWRVGLLAYGMKQKRSTASAVDILLRDSCAVETTLALAHTEFKIIDKFPELDPVKHLSKVNIFFAQKDRWVPPNQRDFIGERWGQHSKISLFPPAVTHSFVFKYNEVVAETLTSQVYSKYL